MRSLINQFMEAVLGPEAAGALQKAADQSSTIDSVLGPYAILGWLKLTSRWGYEGEVPGMPGSYLTFAKSEEGFSGELRWGKHTYDFQKQGLTHVAAALSCALGVDKPVSKSLKDTDLCALGENVDLLLKTQLLAKAEESSSYCDCGSGKWEDRGECEVSGCDCDCHVPMGDERSPDDSTEKFEAPGGQATQRPPSGFQAPQAQVGKAPSRNKKKGFQARVALSQASTKCSVCDAPQFSGDVFTACHCLRDLAKSASVETTSNGYLITFGPEWTKQDVLVFMDIVGGKA